MPNNYHQNHEDQAQINQIDEDENINRTEKQPSSIGRSQKIAAVLLAFFAVLILGLWAAQFKKSLSEPFAYKGETNTSGVQNIGQESDQALKIKDTDKDGLADWDELYLYNTSPYLEDSDSDGFSDKKEIDSSNDPNCPTGRDCYSAGIIDGDQQVVNGGDTAEDSSLNSLLNTLGYEEPEEPSPSATVDIGQLLGSELDAVTLRQLLLEYGMKKEILDQISDEELMQSFQEIMVE